MKRHFLTLSVLALCGLLVFAGCKKKVATADSPVKRTFKASIGGDGGKTSLNPSTGAVYWTDGDQIKVNGTSLTLGDGEGTTMGSFSGSVSGDYYVGAYPAANATVNDYSSSSSARVTFSLPATQTLTENSFSSGANPMVAKSSTTDIAFRNVCGGLCIRIWATSGSADKVVVTSKSGAKLNGTYTVDYSGDTPSPSLTAGGTNVITMTTASPITLSTDEDNPTKFFVMLPVGTYTGGFNVQVYSGDTKILDNDYSPASSIERNNIKLLRITQAAATPSVTTTAVSNISTTTAQSGGSGIDAAGGTISAKGVCWSTTTGPTISDSRTNEGEGTATFTSSLTGLTPGTLYYVRAYVTNSYGTTVYGGQESFTSYKAPVVTTTAATSVGATSATLNSDISADFEPDLTSYGFVYSKKSEDATPEIGGTYCTSVSESGTTTTAFSKTVTGLTKGTTYCFRAYAYNAVSDDPVYGSVLEFTTATNPGGTISGVFTVAASGARTKVYFGSGNLEHVSGTYKFAETQWTDHSGNTDDDVYYFYHPTASSAVTALNTASYQGTSNWSMLSKDEWAYVFNTRTTVDGTAGQNHNWKWITISDVTQAGNSNRSMTGALLFPDDYGDVSGVSTTQTKANMADLEAAGCVFLPAAGGLGSGPM